VAIGSGSSFALAAARAFIQAGEDHDLEQIVEDSMRIAAGICPFTNDHISVMNLPVEGEG